VVIVVLTACPLLMRCLFGRIPACVLCTFYAYPTDFPSLLHTCTHSSTMPMLNTAARETLHGRDFPDTPTDLHAVVTTIATRVGRGWMTRMAEAIGVSPSDITIWLGPRVPNALRVYPVRLQVVDAERRAHTVSHLEVVHKASQSAAGFRAILPTFSIHSEPDELQRLDEIALINYHDFAINPEDNSNSVDTAIRGMIDIIMAAPAAPPPV
jgi:hypothetical protein